MRAKYSRTLIMARAVPYLQMSNFPAGCARDEIGALVAYRTKELLQNRRNFCAVDLCTARRIRAKRYSLRFAAHIRRQRGFRKKIVASSRFQRLAISVNELFASRELLLSLACTSCLISPRANTPLLRCLISALKHSAGIALILIIQLSIKYRSSQLERKLVNNMIFQLVIIITSPLWLTHCVTNGGA